MDIEFAKLTERAMELVCTYTFARHIRSSISVSLHIGRIIAGRPRMHTCTNVFDMHSQSASPEIDATSHI